MDRIRLSKIAVLFKRGIHKFYAKDVVVGVKSRVMLFVFFRKGIPFSLFFPPCSRERVCGSFETLHEHGFPDTKPFMNRC